ncbi:serine/arginine repetitive matrix protein 1-like [Photinus pyralis]|uniref:serine/arginine repetitive matrix protein 1-like n=1 Tax=Photinus pyralis TaxID=7054 RepID=UPI00126711F9|nr:serine/arginine repetitive matrix protein 1-like [Photinus pyralis]
MAQLPSPRLRHYRTMTAICFVCNLPILSHQVGLVWQGGNGWDDLVREQLEESTIRQRLGGRRDSATQICSISPPTETQETSPPTTGTTRRRRSSLAQLTDILREWGGGSTKSRQKAPLNRRETLADLARSLPWGRQTTTETGPTPSISTRKRRESSADSGIKSIGSKSRRDSHQTAISDFRSEVAKLWQRRESNTVATVITPSSGSRRGSGESSRSGRRDSVTHSHGTSRRGSGESGRSGRRDSTTIATPPPPKVIGATHKKRRDSRTVNETPSYYRQEQRPSTSSTASDSAPAGVQTTASHINLPISTVTSHTISIGTDFQCMQPPTIITSSVTPPATSPTVQATTPTHPLLSTRRDSTTQCGRLGRRDSRSHASPERSTNKLSRLQRQNTTYDETCLPGGNSRRGSQPGALSPDVDDTGRKARRDSLSPDSASRGRRDSRSHLSPDRSGERDISPVRRHRRGRLRRQSTSVAGRRRSHRSPDSSSCSSRDPSPSNRPIPPPPEPYRPTIRRQSTTEEILIARGFRRQSTTEEMIRCRNFRRQSSQSDDTSRYRGRRDSCTQIMDGTIASMTVETTSTFFDSSTQTEPSPLYDNNHYHEECLRCNSCGLNLTGPNQKRARRFKNQILCDLHFADVALMECSDFMQQLRSFKPQSLGCAVARRKSSTTLIFPLPPQACSDECHYLTLTLDITLRHNELKSRINLDEVKQRVNNNNWPI